MFTHQPTHHPHRPKRRIGTRPLAVTSAIAIAFAILLLALLSAARTTASTAPNSSAPPHIAMGAITTRPPCYFRDPATHALLPNPRHHGRCRKRTMQPA
jgi:hypothetical protein